MGSFQNIEFTILDDSIHSIRVGVLFPGRGRERGPYKIILDALSKYMPFV